MASWSDVASYIRNNYKVAVDEPNHIGLIFGVDGLRSQTVHLWKQLLMDGTEEWVQLESPFGKLGDGDLDAAIREVGSMVCGGVACTGEYLVLRHSIPLVNVDINEIARPLTLVTNSADQLERSFTGRDDF